MRDTSAKQKKKQKKDPTDLSCLSNTIWLEVYRYCLKSMFLIFSTYPDDDVKVSIEILGGIFLATLSQNHT